MFAVKLKDNYKHKRYLNRDLSTLVERLIKIKLMKKLLIILLSVLSLTVFAQQKKVAVYVTGNDPINDIVASRLVDGIAKSGKYIAIERTASFLSELSKEQSYQQTGAVDDNEISRLGKQFGVDYVCVASTFDVWGSEKYISTRMIDVETAEVVVSSCSNGSITSSSQLIAALNTLSDGLLSSFEQSKLSTAKKVAVYVNRTGNKDVDIILGDQLVAGFAQSGRYFAIERTQGFLNQLSKEQNYQHTGAVDDAELTRLGKQFGVHYVCIAKTSQLFGDYFISTRLIDVETATVVNSWNKEGAQLSNAQGVVTAAQEIARKLSGRTIDEEKQFQIEEAKRIERERLEREEQERLRILREAEEERLRIQQEEYRKQQAEKARIQANINRPWRELLINTLSDAGRCSIGRSHFKLYAWDCGNDDLYCGEYDDDGNMEGWGMYICTGTLRGTDNGRYYVGNWKNHKKQGENGSLYNKDGKLIYYGKFFNDKPTGAYLTGNSMSEYTFGVINYKNGDKYVGELKDGKRQGQGLYLWINGGIWYGKWNDGKRSGYGIYISNSGDYSTGSWDGDTKEW